MLAAICYSLGFAFPDLPIRYANIASDNDLLNKIRKVLELKSRLKRIPNDIQYLGLTNELLEFVALKMTVPKECRQTAVDVANSLQEMMAQHSFTFNVYCT